jgi:hypothetical protein
MAEGILNTDVAKEAMVKEAMELLGDTEYSLPFYTHLENNPLFKVGFDPKRVYYQRDQENPDYPMKYNIAGRQFGRWTLEDLKEKVSKYTDEGSKYTDRQIAMNKPIWEELVRAAENKEIDTTDFVWMEQPSTNLNDPENLMTTIHEFVHRSMFANPEYTEWWNENNLWKDQREHGIISYMLGQEFPKLKEKEYRRAQAVYDIDLNNKETEDEFKKLYKEATQISQNILKERLEEARAKEPIAPIKDEEIKDEEIEKSWFQNFREKIGFNEGGLVSKKMAYNSIEKAIR